MASTGSFAAALSVGQAVAQWQRLVLAATAAHDLLSAMTDFALWLGVITPAAAAAARATAPADANSTMSGAKPPLIAVVEDTAAPTAAAAADATVDPAACAARRATFMADHFVSAFAPLLLWDQHTLTATPLPEAAPAPTAGARASKNRAKSADAEPPRRAVSLVADWAERLTDAQRAVAFDVWFRADCVPSQCALLALANALAGAVNAVEARGSPTAAKLRHATAMEYAARQLARWAAVPTTGTPAAAAATTSGAAGGAAALWRELQVAVTPARDTKPAAVARAFAVGGVDAKAKAPKSGAVADREPAPELAEWVVGDAAVRVIDALGSVPDRVTNAFANATPAIFRSHAFYGLMLDHALAALEQSLHPQLHVVMSAAPQQAVATPEIQAAAATGSAPAGAVVSARSERLIALVSAVMSKVTRRGHAGVVVDRAVPRVTRCVAAAASAAAEPALSAVPSVRDAMALALSAYRTALMRVAPAVALEQVLERVVRALSRDASLIPSHVPVLLALLQPALSTSASASHGHSASHSLVAFIVTHKFLLVKLLPVPALQLLVSTLHAASQGAGVRAGAAANGCAFVVDALARCARVWADAGFLRHALWPQHYYVTHALLLCLQCLEAEAKRSAGSGSGFGFDLERHSALSDLMGGVQLRLSDPVTKVRRLGMRVAEAFSRVIDPSNPLRFDDLPRESLTPAGAVAAAGAADADADADAEEQERQRKEKAEREALDADAAASALRVDTGRGAEVVHPLKRVVGFQPAAAITAALPSTAAGDSKSSVTPAKTTGKKVLIETVDDDDGVDADFVTPAAAAAAAAAAVRNANAARAPAPVPAPAVAVAATSAGATGGSGGSGNSELRAYSLADNRSDLAAVKAPAYLRDVIDYLRVRESDTHQREHIAAALRACPALVRARPDDLDEVCVELLSTLLWVGPIVTGFAESTAAPADPSAASDPAVHAAGGEGDGDGDGDGDGGGAQSAALAAAAKAAVAAAARSTRPEQKAAAVAAAVALDAAAADLDGDLLRCRLDACVALCVECTSACVPFAVRAFYADNQTVMQRVDVLEVLEAAARELAGHTAPPHTPSQPSGKPTATAVAPASASASASASATTEAAKALEVVRQRVERNTRRWGSLARHRAPAPVAVANRFASHARLFFSPLISGLEPPRTASMSAPSDLLSAAAAAADTDGGGGGANAVMSEPLLLSRVLYLCGFFVQCSGAGLDTPQLCRQLLTAVWFTRLHGAASVRRSSVYALSRVFAVLPESVMFAHFGAELPDAIEWLIHTERHDADAETQALARHCLLALKQLMGDNPFLKHSLQQTAAAAAAVPPVGSMAAALRLTKPPVRLL